MTATEPEVMVAEKVGDRLAIVTNLYGNKLLAEFYGEDALDNARRFARVAILEQACQAALKHVEAHCQAHRLYADEPCMRLEELLERLTRAIHDGK